MSIALTSPPAAAQPAASGAVKAQDGAAELSPAAQARQQLNTAILQSSLTVSIQAENAPLALLFKTALTGINEALQAQLGPDAIDKASSLDNTPEGTASRIVSLSTAFYDAFKQQHPGEDEDVLLNKFLDTVKGGAETGFKEARAILDGLKVLSGEVAANIDKTYDLVQKGYDDFAAARRQGAQGSASSGALPGAA
ncbi:MAG: DUF5610 domain-containing protein [Pseudomonadota bacterium]